MQIFKRILLTICLTTALISCGYDGSYRYPCQDPANWETADCKPPICTASDTCTTDMLPKEMNDAPISTPEP
jgi:hypothetical protein